LLAYLLTMRRSLIYLNTAEDARCSPSRVTTQTTDAAAVADDDDDEEEEEDDEHQLRDISVTSPR